MEAIRSLAVSNAATFWNPIDVRDLRKRMGLTQQQLAERLHVTPLTVLRWEASQSVPRPLALAKLREVEQEFAASRTATRSRAAPAPQPVGLDFAGDPDAVLAVAEAHRLAFGHQFNPTFASEISRIDPLPHQRIAVYEHMLPQDPLRFLLADDAGAGKTIMTGLAVREMLSRGRIRRVLVVPPAGLVGNWERELRTLFRLSFRIVAGEDCRAGNPFHGAGSDLAIVSLDTLARGTAFDRLRSAETAPYDLVVFDEAHKLAAETVRGRTAKTQRYELAEALAGCAEPASDYPGLPWRPRHLLLLTATPHMGKDSPYHLLWRLLDPHAFATGEAFRRFPREARARHFIRRTKEEMVDLQGNALYRERKCGTFGYDLSASEQALYDTTTGYLTDTFSQAMDNRGAARLALGVFQRRLASSAWALLRSFDRRIEKLERYAADLQSGNATLQDLAGQSRRFERRKDYFDEHSADDDYREGQPQEAHEDFETEVLGAMVAATVEDLQAEVETLTALRGMAQDVLTSGDEAKFTKLREVLEGGGQAAQDKWLVFTEHRDTLEYLVQRLEGLGYVGQVAQIHGGMDWREREAQVAQFRQPDGARFCIATDAAGEGINLQFCARMANYDIPWNPARLEQRMGRIHRYGQARDVVIVNLVAVSTREGRVLARLLEKLEAIRTALSSDKVFDVIGRLFENVSLMDMILGATTEDGERDALAMQDASLTAEHVAALGDAEQDIYGATGDVAGRIEQLQGDIERERYLQLTPGYVRQFVASATALLGLEIRGDLDDVFALAPREAGALDALLPAFAAYDAETHDKLRVYRPDPSDAAACIWLHPGEPVFDALAAQVIEHFAADALRGSIFIDPRASEPYLCHLAIASLRLQDEAAASSTLLERRLVAVRHNAEGEPALCPVEPLLLLHSAPHVPPGAVPLATRAVGMKADAAGFLAQTAHEEMAEERRTALRTELPERQRQASAGFDLRAAELATKRQALGKEADAEALAAVKEAQRDLLSERVEALNALASEPDRVVAGETQFIAHALAIPPPEGDETQRYDERVEDIAVRIATAWERERGATVQDVSKPNLARNAGLSNWPGFDLLATQPNGQTRRIEVKGRAGRDGIHMETNEWKQACHWEQHYWLYVVFDCATPKPQLLRVQDPVNNLLANRRESAAFAIAVSAVVEAAEGD